MSAPLRQMIRPPAVAGLFYPAEADELRNQVESLLAAVGQPSRAPKAVISPHAGYIYSGQTAAHAYRALSARKTPPSRVVLIGPCHRVAISGLALPTSSAFETPLGKLEVDRGALAELAELPGVSIDESAHAREHSLEVQLPFLQVVFGAGFRIVPLVVGDATVAELDAATAKLSTTSDATSAAAREILALVPETTNG